MNQTANNVLNHELERTLKFLMLRVQSAEPVKVEKCFSSTWLGLQPMVVCEADRRFGGIGGILMFSLKGHASVSFRLKCRVG